MGHKHLDLRRSGVRSARATKSHKSYARLTPYFVCEAKAGRPGLSSLLRPPLSYRIDKAENAVGERWFERPSAARGEDTLRATLLTSSAGNAGVDPAEASKLAAALADGVATSCPPISLASSLYMRDLRWRVTGAMWQLHDELAALPQSVFTLLPRGYSLTPDELADFKIIRAKHALRSALNRAGAGAADGTLMASLHGEYDESTGRFQLHWHGWATGDMIKVVKRLRRQVAFDSSIAARTKDCDGVRNRVWVSRDDVGNVAYRLAYLVQSFWPHRPTGVPAETASGDEGRFRVRGRRRIPEPEHSRYLLWVDRWRIEDVSILMKVSVFGGRLHASCPGTPYTNGVR